MLSIHRQCDQISKKFATFDKFLLLWKFFDCLFSIWKNFEPTLAKLQCFWVNNQRSKIIIQSLCSQLITKHQCMLALSLPTSAGDCEYQIDAFYKAFSSTNSGTFI